MTGSEIISKDTLHARWLGRVNYDEALQLQRGLLAGTRNHLLLLEHPAVFTVGRSGSHDNILCDPESVGAIVREVDRGGDVTLHAPGQLVGYPVLNVPGRGGGLSDTAKFVESIEELIIDTLNDLGLTNASRLEGYTGVWLDANTANERKIAAIGVRIKRGRSLHGFALNVNVDPQWFTRLIPCGIPDKAVTTLAQEGIDVSMQEVVETLLKRAEGMWGTAFLDYQAVAFKHRRSDLSAFSRGEGPGAKLSEKDLEAPVGVLGSQGHLETSQAASPAGQNGVQQTASANRSQTTEAPVRLLGRLADAGVQGGLQARSKKPDWMRVKAKMGPDYRRIKSVMRGLELVTVCEEAGCPNIFECWNEGTATFMINGERCTRKCGFCLVDTRKPEPIDLGEAERVADAVERMSLDYAVITCVARDDLADGGASGFKDTIQAVKKRRPDTSVEVLISDCKGDAASLDVIFDAAPDVMNHNIESVARLQRAVRPSAGYARSLAVLARAKSKGLITKSSIIVGMGETFDEVVGTLADLAAIGVNIVTIGQYLRPTTNHLPISRWWTPQEFDELAAIGKTLGLDHVEAAPLSRSSYHAKSAEAAALA